MAREKQFPQQVTTGSNLTDEDIVRNHGLHHDHVAEEALGGRTADLGKSYFTSINFIGTVIVGLCVFLFSKSSLCTGYMFGANIRVSLCPTHSIG